MTIIILRGLCPRCGGVLFRDEEDGEPGCLMCGYREARPPTVYEQRERRREPSLKGEHR